MVAFQRISWTIDGYFAVTEHWNLTPNSASEFSLSEKLCVIYPTWLKFFFFFFGPYKINIKCLLTCSLYINSMQGIMRMVLKKVNIFKTAVAQAFYLLLCLFVCFSLFLPSFIFLSLFWLSFVRFSSDSRQINPVGHCS